MSIKELAIIKVGKSYKPRRLKQDAEHRLMRMARKIKSKRPDVKRKAKIYRDKYNRKNKVALKRRSQVVRKQRKAMGLD